MASNSATKLATQQSIKAYADTKIAKATNVTSIDDAGIADGEVAIFDLTNKKIKTSDKTLPSGAIVGTTDTQTLTNKTLTSPKLNENVVVTVKASELNGLLTGWIPAGETWTYAGADDPTFTFKVSADVTGKYSAGMKIKLTQGTVKYFIITAVSTYSGGNTTITVYGGTDYDLANATISNPYYSPVKCPYGFPMSPAKWSVAVNYTSDFSQSPTTGGVWYNATSINIPVGLYNVSYSIPLGTSLNGLSSICKATLSTANNSESDSYFTSVVRVRNTGVAGGEIIETVKTVRVEKVLELSSKTTYYLNAMTDVGANISIRGTSYHPAVITAVCAYL
jgi:hypothetical protein